MNKNQELSNEIYAKGIEFSFWLLEKYPEEFFVKFENFKEYMRSGCDHTFITNGNKRIFCSNCGLVRHE